MKKIFTLLLVTAIATAFVSCSNSDDPKHSGGYTTISGVIQNMPTDAESYTVEAFIGDNEQSIATANVAANGSFTITLPATVAAANLTAIDTEGIPSTISVSNPDAKVGMLFLELYADDYYEDDLVYANYSISATALSVTQTMPFYSDSPCTVKGNGEIEGMKGSVNGDIVKGWNWGVVSAASNAVPPTPASTTVTISSKLPGGLKWFLDEDLPDIFE